MAYTVVKYQIWGHTMMKDKDAWFKPSTRYGWNGKYEGGLMPSNWKGYVLTLVFVGLSLSAWRLADYFSSIHQKNATIAAWISIPIIILIYMQIANMTSNRP
jgi:hypothetical protein